MNDVIEHKFKEENDYSVGLKFSFCHENGADVSKELRTDLLEENESLFIKESIETVITEIQNGRYETGDNDEFKLTLEGEDVKSEEKRPGQITVNVMWELIPSALGFASARFDKTFNELLEVEKTVEINVDLTIETNDEEIEEKNLEIDEQSALEYIKDRVFIDVERHRRSGRETFKYEGIKYFLIWHV